MIDLKKLISGDRRTLAKAITLVESHHELHKAEAAKLIDQALPHSGKSLRLGISGSPGVGKSTFIEAFGNYLVDQGRKLAVVAVDPSSPITGGSILGDKTRMESLSRREEVFIRPSPSLGFLGGVAQSTREAIILCEAAGFDTILVETVGVGQSEITAASMVDFFIVLILPNSGDELQGIKKGIIEMASAIIINKADGDSKTAAELTKGQYEGALELLPDSSKNTQAVLLCSAKEKTGLDEIWKTIQKQYNDSLQSGAFSQKRRQQLETWFYDQFKDSLIKTVLDDSKYQKDIKKELKLVLDHKSGVSSSVHRILDLILK
ncbi:MAG: methylmalonyl Co-A mutase-associated GTPase MeaB [Bdellovibrio sp.]